MRDAVDFNLNFSNFYELTQIIVAFKFLVYYAVPLCFIATFYIIMAKHLVLSTRNMPGEAQGQAKQSQGRKKVMHTSIAPLAGKDNVDKVAKVSQLIA